MGKYTLTANAPGISVTLPLCWKNTFSMGAKRGSLSAHPAELQRKVGSQHQRQTRDPTRFPWFQMHSHWGGLQRRTESSHMCWRGLRTEAGRRHTAASQIRKHVKHLPKFK
jgi:hypothetical protein